MVYSNEVTPNPDQSKLASLPKRTWWNLLFNRFTAKPQTDKAVQTSSTDSKSNSYQTEVRSSKSFLSEVEAQNFKRLDGGWIYNNFNQLR